MKDVKENPAFKTHQTLDEEKKTLMMANMAAKSTTSDDCIIEANDEDKTLVGQDFKELEAKRCDSNKAASKNEEMTVSGMTRTITIKIQDMTITIAGLPSTGEVTVGLQLAASKTSEFKANESVLTIEDTNMDEKVTSASSQGRYSTDGVTTHYTIQKQATIIGDYAEKAASETVKGKKEVEKEGHHGDNNKIEKVKIEETNYELTKSTECEKSEAMVSVTTCQKNGTTDDGSGTGAKGELQDHAIASSANTVNPVIGLSKHAIELQATGDLGRLTHGPTPTINTQHVEKPTGVYVKLLGLKNWSRFKGFRSGTKEIDEGTVWAKTRGGRPARTPARSACSIGSSTKVDERERKLTKSRTAVLKTYGTREIPRRSVRCVPKP
jgi:hypothetical protein